MSPLRVLARVAVAVTVLAPHAPAFVFAQAADAQIHQALQRFEDGYAAADPDSVVAAMTDDAALL